MIYDAKEQNVKQSCKNSSCIIPLNWSCLTELTLHSTRVGSGFLTRSLTVTSSLPHLSSHQIAFGASVGCPKWISWASALIFRDFLWVGLKCKSASFPPSDPPVVGLASLSFYYKEAWSWVLVMSLEFAAILYPNVPQNIENQDKKITHHLPRGNHNNYYPFSFAVLNYFGYDIPRWDYFIKNWTFWWILVTVTFYLSGAGANNTFPLY